MEESLLGPATPRASQAVPEVRGDGAERGTDPVVHGCCAGLDVHKKTVQALPAAQAGRTARRWPSSGACHHHGERAGPAGLVDRSGLHARGDGVDRGVLEESL